MNESYKPMKSMKEVPDHLKKLRRQYLRYQQAELVYSLSHKKLLELASEAGAIYRMDSTVLINRDIFDAYLSENSELYSTGLKSAAYDGLEEGRRQEYLENLSIILRL